MPAHRSGVVLAPGHRSEDRDRAAAKAPGQLRDLGPALVDERTTRPHRQTVSPRRCGPPLPARNGPFVARHAKRATPRLPFDTTKTGTCEVAKSGRRESNSRSQLGKLMFCL